MEFLAQYGYWVLFLGVLCEQLGLPLPAMPILLGMGALAADGQFTLSTCVLLAMLASVIADTVWYRLGRRNGQSVLKLLCRISLEPDTCVSVAKDWFRRTGDATLLFAKFIPAFSTVATAMAGVNQMPLLRFLVLDGLGSAAWAGIYLWAGFVFGTRLERLLSPMKELGLTAGLGLALLLAAYIAWKWWWRYRMVRRLRATRMTPADLLSLMRAGEALTVLDLRRGAEIASSGKIPGAAQIPVLDLDARHHEIPRDRQIVLYCICPNEATSAKVAMQLERKGIRNVRLLEGGYEAWVELGFAVETVEIS